MATVSLELTLVLRFNDSSSITLIPTSRNELFKALGGTELERLHFLCFIINPRMSVRGSVQDIFGGPLASLENAMLASMLPVGHFLGPNREVLHIIDQTSKHLEGLYFENVDTEFLQSVKDFGFWNRITKIIVKKPQGTINSSLFDDCNSLKFLSLDGDLETSPLNRKTTPCPHLEWLRLGGITMSGLSKLNLSHIQYLTIRSTLANNWSLLPPPHSVELPSLQVLHISTINPTIQTLFAPKLETLCLSIPTLKQADANDILQSVFDGHEQMLKPRDLTIQAPIHEIHLLDALKSLPDLHTLTLDHEFTPTKVFFRALTPPSSNSRNLFQSLQKPYRLCRKLRNLSLDFYPASNHEYVKKMLGTLIEKRKASPDCLDLRSVTVKWSDSKEEQLVPISAHSYGLHQRSSRGRQKSFP
jgi:hypothetical protein